MGVLRVEHVAVFFEEGHENIRDAAGDGRAGLAATVFEVLGRFAQPLPGLGDGFDECEEILVDNVALAGGVVRQEPRIEQVEPRFEDLDHAEVGIDVLEAQRDERGDLESRHGKLRLHVAHEAVVEAAVGPGAVLDTELFGEGFSGVGHGSWGSC
ncbi:MAG: hypothetical protein IT368_13315 [Candidatus Hydrogenedentes bacterium]|nr:hypothetical protein [Candidatus Hydrogenedentota bacterium]